MENDVRKLWPKGWMTSRCVSVRKSNFLNSSLNFSVFTPATDG